MITRLIAILFANVAFSHANDTPLLKLPPGETGEQIVLSELEEGTQVNAEGVIVFGGESEHYLTPPTFSLHSSRLRDPDRGIGYPDNHVLESRELPNREIYPFQLRDSKNITLSGLTVLGLQSEDLPWRVVKQMWDGDALLVKNCEGRVAIKDVFFRNTEDGFGPEKGIEHWRLERAWMEDIRDDAIENDFLLSGEIDNCLIDGCFVFLSQRNPDGRTAEPTTVIRDSLIRISAQAHDGVERKPWRDRFIHLGEDGIGRAPGMLFKWAGSAGKVRVENCLFYMDAVSVNGPDEMRFPPGTYEKVTLIWTGEEPYPMPLPSGVVTVSDPGIWEEAKANWIKNLPANHPGLQRP
ncbi:MAG: hypothetical protein P1U68_02570 [Verrucomicrobiales bacterium]|nr:hypothetical protein [Verrucomicrobiales bacterium]